MRTEVQVDIMDLIKFMLKQWKKILLAGLCGLVLLSGIYVIICYLNSSNGNKESNITDSKVVLEELKGNLTEEEVVEVEEALNFYLSSVENYEQLKKYTANSLLYKIDANNTPTYRLVYGVEDFSQNEDAENQNEIREGLNSWIQSDETIQAIIDEAGIDIDIIYVRELITFKYDVLSNCFNIQVVSPDMEMTEKLARATDSVIEKRIQVLKGIYSDFEIRKVSMDFSIEISNDIQSMQYNMMQRLSNVKSILTVYRYDLEENQQLYYDALLSEKEEIVDEVKQETSFFSPTIIVFGAIVGIFVMLFYLLMKYLLSDTLKVKEDISQTFHSHVFGELVSDKFDENIWTVLCDNVKYACNKNEVKNLLIAGTCSDVEVVELKERLRSVLEKQFENIEMAIIDKDCMDVLNTVKACDAVVCVEKIQKSKYTDIQREIELCEYYDSTLLGFVLVK